MSEKDRRQELAKFLRVRRAQVKPGDVGLPDGVSQRRTPGLRREEVSQLSGIGLTWYTWLEQARDISTSRQVVDALARALQLNTEDRHHLAVLAGVGDPARPAGEQVSEAVRRMVDGVSPNPAYVINARFDVLAWNRAQTALWLDLDSVPAEDRNLVWLMFTEPTVRLLLRDWTNSARSLLAQFRATAGRHPGDQRVVDLTRRLKAASPLFSDWWDGYPVAEFAIELNVLDHPEVGELRLDLMHLTPIDEPTLTVVLQTPHSPQDAQRLAALCAPPGGIAVATTGRPGGVQRPPGRDAGTTSSRAGDRPDGPPPEHEQRDDRGHGGGAGSADQSDAVARCE